MWLLGLAGIDAGVTAPSGDQGAERFACGSVERAHAGAAAFLAATTDRRERVILAASLVDGATYLVDLLQIAHRARGRALFQLLQHRVGRRAHAAPCGSAGLVKVM